MFFFKFQQFFSPDDSGGGSDGDFSADMAVLNEPSGESAPAPEKTRTFNEEPTTEDLAEEEEDGEDQTDEGDETDEGEESEETDEADAPVQGKPTLKAIKEQFPGIFKKFPELKAALFRDQEFSKYHATPEDAAQAAVKADNYDRLESTLVQGSPDLLMSELAENNPKAFKEVALNWLPKLREIDEKLFISATEPVLEELIFLAFKHGEKTGDKNLAMSARHLANFIFANGGEIPDISKKQAKEPNPAEIQLQQERQQWAQTRFQEADGEIFNFVTSSLDQTIRQGLDPAGTMPERMKASIVQDVINEMNSQLAKDPVHARRMQGLWKRAAGDAYSRQSKESIVNTYLSGARPLLRDLRNRIRSEYLGSSPTRKVGNGKDEKLAATPQKKKPFEGSSKRVDQRRERATVLDPKKIDYAHTTDLDILSGKVTLKK